MPWDATKQHKGARAHTGMSAPLVALNPASLVVLVEYPLPVSGWAKDAGRTRRQSRRAGYLDHMLCRALRERTARTGTATRSQRRMGTAEIGTSRVATREVETL